jgi:hypothetical protein
MVVKEGADFISVSGRFIGCKACYVIGKRAFSVSRRCDVIYFKDGAKENCRHVDFFDFVCHNISVYDFNVSGA